MSTQRRQTARKPATKFPHLRKKMQQQQVANVRKKGHSSQQSKTR